MNMLILIAKVAIVLFFLFMFLRSDKLVWGIGLLTVTSAILLDTLLSTFGWEEIVATLGFFFFVFAGVIFSGAAIWFWLVVRPYLPPNTDKEIESPEQIVERPVVAPIAEASDVSSNPAVDRKTAVAAVLSDNHRDAPGLTRPIDPGSAFPSMISRNRTPIYFR